MSLKPKRKVGRKSSKSKKSFEVKKTTTEEELKERIKTKAPLLWRDIMYDRVYTLWERFGVPKGFYFAIHNDKRTEKSILAEARRAFPNATVTRINRWKSPGCGTHNIIIPIEKF